MGLCGTQRKRSDYEGTFTGKYIGHIENSRRPHTQDEYGGRIFDRLLRRRSVAMGRSRASTAHVENRDGTYHLNHQPPARYFESAGAVSACAFFLKTAGKTPEKGIDNEN